MNPVKIAITSLIALFGASIVGLLLTAVWMQTPAYCPPDQSADRDKPLPTNMCKGYEREGSSNSEKLTETAIILLFGLPATVGAAVASYVEMD